MYHKAKYIVGEISDDFGRVIAAVVFSEVVSHQAMSRVFIPGTIRSAGFCHADEDDVKVYGESVGLKKKSDPDNDPMHVGRAMAHQKYIS